MYAENQPREKDHGEQDNRPDTKNILGDFFPQRVEGRRRLALERIQREGNRIGRLAALEPGQVRREARGEPHAGERGNRWNEKYEQCGVVVPVRARPNRARASEIEQRHEQRGERYRRKARDSPEHRRNGPELESDSLPFHPIELVHLCRYRQREAHQ